ncbi:hypothetical protein [Lactobacillus crispatus]|uniref:hypothetical protein n=1 Tax=Lactobacillus crispatus TaxID=47770 RepID=UPI0021A745EA|nr:hypothetical protein [Lactobacillus crispatus]MCT3539718.1 hypothetical protein [Lactobacillus crispatus]
MANVFEVESNASQDANYREHLNRNWQNGNTEFDKLENWLNALETTFSNFQTQINNLQQQIWNLTKRVQEDEVKHDQDVAALTKKHNSDIATLNEIIEKQDARISKLENAVFGYGEYEVNYETPSKTIDHVFEINTDSNPKLKGE